ncbi:MAG: SDR family NAD(P)-dependent oxidoreductase [Planctomycetota bacterium]
MKSNQSGKTAVLSGSTGGIGNAIAKLLGERGYDLALVNRSASKMEAQANELREACPGISITTFTADLLDQSQIIEVCKEIEQTHPRVAAIFNVAGLLTSSRIESAQGIEGHFAINTVAPFLFAKHLSGGLDASAKSGERPVVVTFGSSAVNSLKGLDVGSLANPSEIGGLMGAYAKTKLALTAMTLYMSEAQRDSGVSFLCVDPGPTKTTMTNSGDGMPWFLKLLVPFIFKSAEVQAKRLVDGVEKARADGETGLYISEGKRKTYPVVARNETIQAELNQLLMELSTNK